MIGDGGEAAIRGKFRIQVKRGSPGRPRIAPHPGRRLAPAALGISAASLSQFDGKFMPCPTPQPKSNGPEGLELS